MASYQYNFLYSAPICVKYIYIYILYYYIINKIISGIIHKKVVSNYWFCRGKLDGWGTEENFHLILYDSCHILKYVSAPIQW